MRPEFDVEEPVSLSMDPYTGPWQKAQAAHLLRRTLFGMTYPQLEQAVSLGMNASVDQLLTLVPTPPPLTYLPDEAVANFGDTWVNSLYPSDPLATEGARRSSLAAWMIERLNKGEFSIQEKMCLFWQNHFAAEYTFDSRATYNYHELIRTHALGNFKQFVKDITIDPCMLIFLSGAVNNQFMPNENYARELFELYSIGKGPQIGDGDYSFFKELDIFEASKVLTGWTVQGALSQTDNTTYAEFMPVLHDNSVKTLSEYFDEAEIQPNGAQEYADLIDVIFQQDQVATFICTKLYRWFVNYDITQTVQDTIIPEMAQTMIANNYEVLPVLEQLFKSEHFYDVAMRGTIIRNPIEFVISLMNTTMSTPNYAFNENYELYFFAYHGIGALGMEYAQPPSVGGWTAYYQAPAFSRLWASSATLKLRFDIADLLNLGGGVNIGGNKWEVNHIDFLNSLSLPASAEDVIEDIVMLFCPKGLDPIKKLSLKLVLTNGLPDFEWTLQYNEYLADPTNPATVEPVRLRVALTLFTLYKMPEFQVI